mmetsp:Transcript_60862/g.114551  ORF Transcript_60862/g.114551 Transcript_60862/m.114551 type:complete len:366 (-) Transcript_60862:199-1296(-)
MSTQNHANDGSMLLAWGSNKDSQVSDNDDEDARARKAVFGPTPLVESERFLAVAAGEGHSLYVSDTGDVFSSGRGTEGQLGTGKKAVLHKPEPIEALADVVVVGIAAGSHHSIACTAAGRVFMWGLITVDQEDPLAKNQPPPPPGPPSSGGDGTGDGWNSTGGDAGATAQAATGGDARTMLGLTGQTNEVLRRIVRESERRWLTAEEDQATGSTAGQTASGGATGATEEEKKRRGACGSPGFQGRVRSVRAQRGGGRRDGVEARHARSSTQACFAAPLGGHSRFAEAQAGVRSVGWVRPLVGPHRQWARVQCGLQRPRAARSRAPHEFVHLPTRHRPRALHRGSNRVRLTAQPLPRPAPPPPPPP